MTSEQRDARPLNCRFRLQDEGKGYPRSSCLACNKTIATGLGTECSHDWMLLKPAKANPMSDQQAAHLRRAILECKKSVFELCEFTEDNDLAHVAAQTEAKKIRNAFGDWFRSDIQPILDATHPSDDWQPIDENTPKDRPILVIATRVGWERYKGGKRIVCAQWYPSANRWYIYGAGPTAHSEQWLDECTPTHWRPLPQPPREGGE